MKSAWIGLVPLAVSALALAPGGGARADEQPHAGHGASSPSSTSTAPAPPGSVRITMDALHAAGGVPPGWQFKLPPGDPVAGRQVFIDFKCYACHNVRGEQFPLEPGQSATAGPDLTGMARHHPTGYFVESIVNPNAVLVEGPGFIGGDGRSIMPPSPNMTVAQLIDLMAYLEQAGGHEAHGAHADGHDHGREQTVGGYRVRLLFQATQPAAHGHHGHHAQHGQPAQHGQHGHHGQHGQHGQHAHGAHPADSAASTVGRGRLVAIVTDAASGQPVPYLPVTARIDAGQRAAQQVTLAPVFGAGGLRYAADVVLPQSTRAITLTLGPASVAAEPGAPAEIKRAYTVSFQWK